MVLSSRKRDDFIAGFCFLRKLSSLRKREGDKLHLPSVSFWNFININMLQTSFIFPLFNLISIGYSHSEMDRNLTLSFFIQEQRNLTRSTRNLKKFAQISHKFLCQISFEYLCTLLSHQKLLLCLVGDFEWNLNYFSSNTFFKYLWRWNRRRIQQLSHVCFLSAPVGINFVKIIDKFQVVEVV